MSRDLDKAGCVRDVNALLDGAKVRNRVQESSGFGAKSKSFGDPNERATPVNMIAARRMYANYRLRRHGRVPIPELFATGASNMLCGSHGALWRGFVKRRA